MKINKSIDRTKDKIKSKIAVTKFYDDKDRQQRLFSKIKRQNITEIVSILNPTNPNNQINQKGKEQSSFFSKVTVTVHSL